ncbi:hypothetical protein [Aquamicrobium soli]|uniref:Uncharacterized protein n=1 Tax=Aquamicrobium soli TaxID=1811518 RepID=A0ABV7KFU8_9HYPH
MGVKDVGSLSLGEWAAITRRWNLAHAEKPEAPTDDEFDRAIEAARSVN